MGLRALEWLWLGGLLAPLIVLYVLKVRREPLEIPSTLLWRQALTELDAQVPFRRFRRDWLLLLQILILLLLIVAAAGPFRRSLLVAGSRAAIIVDASASMLAAEHLDQARREAGRLVDGLGKGDEVAIVRAGAEPRVVAPLSADRGALRQAIDGIVASPAPADLQAAAELARSLVGDDGELILITDVAGRAPELANLRVRRVGRPLSNTAIVALGVRASDPSGFDHQVFARLGNYSKRNARGTLQLFLDGELRDAASIELAAGEELGRTLRLVAVTEGLVEARWNPEGADALDEDNRALWLLRPRLPRGYRLDGAADAFVRQALSALPGWQPAAPGLPADIEIVQGGAPSVDGPPFLWIDPQPLASGMVDAATVLDWERTHPVLRHVDLHAARLGRIPEVSRPPGARVLASSTAGPLILEGVYQGRRYVAWAFDPLQTDLPLHVSFPVLVQNTLEHLAPADGSLPGGLPTGAAPWISWPEAEPVEIVSPSGRRAPSSVAAGLVRPRPFDEVGVWRFIGATRERAVAVSLVRADEADLRGTGAAAAKPPPPPSGPAESRAGVRDLWRPLALGALLVLLLEGFAFHRRWFQ